MNGAGFSRTQQRVLRSLLTKTMTTTAIGRRTTIPLARMALIMRVEPVDPGPVQPSDEWRLTTVGRRFAEMLK
jgi:hypothetical protein